MCLPGDINIRKKKKKMSVCLTCTEKDEIDYIFQHTNRISVIKKRIQIQTSPLIILLGRFTRLKQIRFCKRSSERD